jgi:predicted RNase H-like HicB family nuclease
MIKNKTLEEVKHELDLDLDLGLALAEAEGNLNHLARESNSSDWQGTITQGITILDALNAVQKARKAFQEIKQNKSK